MKRATIMKMWLLEMSEGPVGGLSVHCFMSLRNVEMTSRHAARVTEDVDDHQGENSWSVG